MTHDSSNGRSQPGEELMALRALPLAALAIASARELQSFIEGEQTEDSHTRELLRRAVTQREEDAWAALTWQYTIFVRAWLLRIQGARLIRDRDGERLLIKGVFALVKQALNEEKLASLKQGFAGVLQYLLMSTWSVLRRLEREEARAALLSAIDQQAAHQPVDPDLPEPGVAEAIWHALCEYCQDAGEERVVYLSFVRGMSPAAIMSNQECPEHVATQEDVWQVKQQVLDRVKQSGRLHTLLL